MGLIFSEPPPPPPPSQQQKHTPVCGMVGCYLGYVDKNSPHLNRRSVSAFKSSVFRSASVLFLTGFLAPVDNYAHLGGFAGGYAFGRVRCRDIGGERRERIERARETLMDGWEGGRRGVGGALERMGRAISPPPP